MATVPLRSLMRAAATSASETAKYGVQATATWRVGARAPIPATGDPSRRATLNSSPSFAGRNSHDITGP